MLHKQFSVKIISLSAFILLSIFLIHISPSQAHETTRHLVCSNLSSETDIIQGAIHTHNTSGVTNFDDGYVYNNPPVDPQDGRFDNYPVLMKVLPTTEQTIYTATQYYDSEPYPSCNYALQCSSDCTPPQTIGTCNNSCNITLQNVSCPMNGSQSTFELKTGGSDTTVSWDDTTAAEFFSGTPNTHSMTHTFNQSGKYDVQAKCGSQLCIKRIQVTCQNGAITPTPSPFPTRVPTPTGGAALCGEGLQCKHPCGCDTSSSPYVNGECASGGNGARGYGTTVGTSAGQICGPGLVCCAPPSDTSRGWVKTKDVSVHRNSSFTNIIPPNASAFNADDTGPCEPNQDDTTKRCLTIGKSGMLTVSGNMSFGDGFPNSKQWARASEGYNRETEFTPDSFIQYTISHREVIYIDDLTQVEKDKVNYLDADHTITEIDNNGLSGKAPFVLLIDNGDLRFDLNSTFNPSQKAMVIVVDGEIEIKSNIGEMNGVFIGNSFDFAYNIADGQTTTNPLWMRGNVISSSSVDCGLKRKRTDGTKPSCFFQMDFLNHYVPNIGLFSVQTYGRTAL